MNLKEARELLEKENNSKDYAVYFDKTRRVFKLQDDYLLLDYLDMIMQDPVEWLRLFPDSITSASAFAKPKAAVVKLTGYQPVREKLGDGFCDRCSAIVDQAYKKHAKGILDERRRVLEHQDVDDSGDGGDGGDDCITNDDWMGVQVKNTERASNAFETIHCNDYTQKELVLMETLKKREKAYEKVKALFLWMIKKHDPSNEDLWKMVLDD